MLEQDKKIVEVNKAAKNSTYNLIYNFFTPKRKKIYSMHTENNLYNAIAILCKEKDIELIPFDDIKNMVDDDFDIRAIARLSHFPIRKIKLEHDWYKKEYGNFLGYYKRSENEVVPVAIIQISATKYSMLDPELGYYIMITKEIAQNIEIYGYTIYRTLGKEELTNFQFIKFLLKELRIKDIIIVLILLSICTIIGLLLPTLNALVFDNYLSFHDFNPILAICSVMLIFNIASIVFDVIRGYIYSRISISIEVVAQQALYDRLIHLPASFLRSYDSADLAKRVMEVTNVFGVFFNTILSAVFTAVFSIAYVSAMFTYSQGLAKAGIGITVLTFIIILPLLFAQTRFARKLYESDAKVSGISWQMVAGIEKIKGAGAENRASFQYMKSYERSRFFTNKITIVSNYVIVIKVIFSVVSTIVFYYIAAQSEDFPIGEFAAFTTAFNIFNTSIIGLLEALANSSNIKPTFEKLSLILKTKPDYSKKGIIIEELKGKIEVQNVSFSYSADTPEVLHDISFKVNPGEYVGIVGTSGSGKSTILRLLLGLEEANNGGIYYDDININTLDKQNLRTKMGVVLQNDKIFAGSINDNLTFTIPHASMELINETIRKVGLEKDIKMMPMGIHTYVSDGGGTLSGGQQQRIMIARAIMSNPSIIYFDEATSALDNVTQDMVCETLRNLDATKVVIAHRLSTVQDCDVIYVMDNGKIAECGNYKELMEKKGIFYELAIRQIAEY